MAVRSDPETSDRRSYAFLIERLLPTHRLDPEQRQRLATALALGDRSTLHRESLAALQELEPAGLFEELPPGRPGTRLFRRLAGGERILLGPAPPTVQQASRPATEARSTTLPEVAADPQAGVDVRVTSRRDPEPPETKGDMAQASRAGVGLEEPAGLAGPAELAMRSAGSEAALVDRAAVAPGTTPEGWAQIESLLELASIEARLEPYGDRLRRVVAQLESILPGAHVRLLCLDAEAAEAIGNGEIEVLDRAEAEEVPHYREALRLGETQFATSAPVGADPASGRIAAAVPIYVSGEPWGLLRVTWEQGSVDSVPELARLLAPLSRLVAVAIQNQTMLEHLVFIDALTGIYNRAFYDRQVTLEIERANRNNQKFALLVMDVDDFKRINDQHGHRAGDQVLAQLAHEVRGRMRKIDLMFRYGGEEFVLLLPGADLEEAQRTAERLRLVVTEQRFLPEGVPTPLRVTVSVGGAVYPDQSRTKTGIFNAADAALYRAKNEGKNRVCF